MKIRPIEETDLTAVEAMLSEGFPRKPAAYWRKALGLLAGRDPVGDLPRFGLLLETREQPTGVMLMIASRERGRQFCNLSSWYVRPDARKYAPYLFQRSLRWKSVTYTDCSPAPHVLPIVEKFGFRPYSGGTILFGPLTGLRRGNAVFPLNGETLTRIDPALRPSLEAQLSYGCKGFLIEKPGHPLAPVLYRTTRLKKHIPAARFLYGDPMLLSENAGSLMRALMGRGVPLMLVDAPEGGVLRGGRLLPEYGRRYFRGEEPPPVGDLRETEMALFGL